MWAVMSVTGRLALAQAAPSLTPSGLDARPLGPSFEQDEVDLSAARQWVKVESAWCVSFNSIDPFTPAAARDPGALRIESGGGDDRVSPVAVTSITTRSEVRGRSSVLASLLCRRRLNER